MMTGLRGASLDWDTATAGNACCRKSQETRPGLSLGIDLRGKRRGGAPRGEPPPYASLGTEHSEGAAASADAASIQLRLTALRLPFWEAQELAWRHCETQNSDA